MCFLLENNVQLNQMPQITKWQFGAWDIQGSPLWSADPQMPFGVKVHILSLTATADHQCLKITCSLLI